jgi:hypothetical protein
LPLPLGFEPIMLLTATFLADNAFLLPDLAKMLSATILIGERLDKFDNIHIISVSHKIAFYILVVRYRTSNKDNNHRITKF